MSPKYNPNSIWTSKKETYEYKPKDRPAEKSSVVPHSSSSFTPTSPSEPKSGSKDAPKTDFWSTPPTKFPPKKSSVDSSPWLARGLVWFGVGIFVIMGILVFYLSRSNQGPNVGVSFSKPDRVLVGDPFILTVSFSNESSKILKGATLSLILPQNVSFVGQSANQRVMQQSVGDLGAGSINKQDFNLITTGDTNSIEHLTAKIIYSADTNSQAHYESDGNVDVLVGESALGLTITAPPNVFSGQNFDITVNYNNNTQHSFNNAALAMQYPPAFTFIKSSIAPNSLGKNSWNLGVIPANASGTFTITGSLVGPNGASYPLGANLMSDFSGQTYTIANPAATVAIATSPLSLSVALNNSPTYTANLGDNLNYTITYENNSNVTFQNLTVTARFVGAMFDFTSLQSPGSFNSLANKVTWYGANTPALLSLAPGQTGSVNVQIRMKNVFPIRLLSDKNYTLRLHAEISSPTVPPDTAASSTVSAVDAENRIRGKIAIDAKGYWRDAPSGILNTGPYPPKVNQATQYTIHWDITNYSTDAQGVGVSAYLQSGTTCTGTIKSNVSTVPTCNPASGLITWAIPSVPATTGVISPPAEAIIQVQNTPAVNQIGQNITLLGPTTLQAADGFTSSTLQAAAQAVMTDLPYDTTITTQNRAVTQ